MVLKTPPPLSSKDLVIQYEKYKLGDLSLNDFAILAIAKATARLRIQFINRELPEGYFDDVQSDISLTILELLHTDNGQKIKNPAAYFSRIADNTVVDLVRKLIILMPTTSQLDVIPVDLYEVDKFDTLDAICSTITDNLDSEILSLRLNGHTQLEIAHKLKQGVSTINFRVAKMGARYNKNSNEV